MHLDTTSLPSLTDRVTPPPIRSAALCRRNIKRIAMHYLRAKGYEITAAGGDLQNLDRVHSRIDRERRPAPTAPHTRTRKICRYNGLGLISLLDELCGLGC